MSQCDLCRSSDYSVYLPELNLRPLAESNFTVFGEQGEHPQLVRCQRCQLIYVHPRDSQKELRDKYEEMSVEEYLLEEQARRLTATRDARMVRTYVPQGRFLDVGCSAGLFLDSLGPDFDRYGTELSKAAAAKAGLLLGQEKIFQGAFEDASYSKGHFDGISFWDVLEHLVSPRAAVDKSREMLKPGGHLFAVVPNISSLVARAMKHRWPHLIRSHLYYFTPETIRRLLQESDFRVLGIKSYSRMFTVRYILERLGAIPRRQSVASGLKNSGTGWIIPVNLFDAFCVIARKDANS